jgi:hypothetical protein
MGLKIYIKITKMKHLYHAFWERVKMWQNKENILQKNTSEPHHHLSLSNYRIVVLLQVLQIESFQP